MHSANAAHTNAKEHSGGWHGGKGRGVDFRGGRDAGRSEFGGFDRHEFGRGEHEFGRGEIHPNERRVGPEEYTDPVKPRIGTGEYGAGASGRQPTYHGAPIDREGLKGLPRGEHFQVEGADYTKTRHADGHLYADRTDTLHGDWHNENGQLVSNDGNYRLGANRQPELIQQQAQQPNNWASNLPSPGGMFGGGQDNDRHEPTPQQGWGQGQNPYPGPRSNGPALTNFQGNEHGAGYGQPHTQNGGQQGYGQQHNGGGSTPHYAGYSDTNGGMYYNKSGQPMSGRDVANMKPGETANYYRPDSNGNMQYAGPATKSDNGQMKCGCSPTPTPTPKPTPKPTPQPTPTPAPHQNQYQQQQQQQQQYQQQYNNQQQYNQQQVDVKNNNTNANTNRNTNTNTNTNNVAANGGNATANASGGSVGNVAGGSVGNVAGGTSTVSGVSATSAPVVNVQSTGGGASSALTSIAPSLPFFFMGGNNSSATAAAASVAATPAVPIVPGPQYFFPATINYQPGDEGYDEAVHKYGKHRHRGTVAVPANAAVTNGGVCPAGWHAGCVPDDTTRPLLKTPAQTPAPR
jgi:hypothetical protein